MQTITIGFSRGRGFKPFSSLIRLYQGTEFSHVYLRRKSESYDAEYVYQASGHSVNFMGLEVFLENNIIIEEYTVNISDEAFARLMQFAIKKSGKKYSKRQIVGIFLKNLGLNAIELKEDEAYICSELMAIILDDILGELELGCDKSFVTPKDINDAIKVHTSFTKTFPTADVVA